MRWCLAGSGKFDVHSFYKAIRGTNGNHFPWKCIWCIKAPKRASIFLWIAAWGKILTIDFSLNFITYQKILGLTDSLGP